MDRDDKMHIIKFKENKEKEISSESGESEGEK